MEITYRIGGATIPLGRLSVGDTFCYPDSDTVFLITDAQMENKIQIVDIESGVRYNYSPELQVIKVKVKAEVSPTL